MSPLNGAPPPASVFVRTILQRGTLSAAEEAVLYKLDQPGLFRRNREDIVTRGADFGGVAILKSGWAASVIEGPNGRRAMPRLYLPGDIIGLSEVFLPAAPMHVRMLCDGSTAFVAREALIAELKEAPSLAQVIVAVEQERLQEVQAHTFALSRLSAISRLRHFFLMLSDRLCTPDAQGVCKFPCYLKKTQIADMNGLSAVTIWQVLAEMEAKGELIYRNNMIELYARQSWAAEYRSSDAA